MASASIPVSKEPQVLSCSDGKRPDSLSLIPLQAEKSLIWDVTVVADLYVAAATQEAAAELAADRKSAKYIDLHSFQLVAIETLARSNQRLCSRISV